MYIMAKLDNFKPRMVTAEMARYVLRAAIEDLSAKKKMAAV